MRFETGQKGSSARRFPPRGNGSQETLRSELKGYEATWFKNLGNRFHEDETIVSQFLKFISENPDCFSRSLLIGHVTGSALVTTADFSRVLLTYHKKLDRWLQLGGHADGNPNIAEVALREAEEESGLEKLALHSKHILDLDIHRIPPRHAEPEHLHYDVRFLVIAAEPDKISLSEESLDLRWFNWKEALEITQERSMHRQFEKLAYFSSRFSLA